ncbi:MAG: T9SS type A sorting domain-containing protein [Bacteroidetes bacterium]|nr:T9SS type A sorting domain-containing protein [Bacteroidota bacterium]
MDIADFKESTLLTIINPIGQKCLEVQLTAASTKLQLDLPTGVYFYAVTKSSGLLTGKILID